MYIIKIYYIINYYYSFSISSTSKTTAAYYSDLRVVHVIELRRNNNITTRSPLRLLSQRITTNLTHAPERAVQYYYCYCSVVPVVVFVNKKQLNRLGEEAVAGGDGRRVTQWRRRRRWLVLSPHAQPSTTNYITIYAVGLSHFQFSIYTSKL